MPLSCCRFLAADNRCASGVRAALPEHFPLLTLTTVCYTCSPSHDSGQHYDCCIAFRLRAIRFSVSFAYPLVGVLKTTIRQSDVSRVRHSDFSIKDHL